jgi:hypothetical protein
MTKHHFWLSFKGNSADETGSFFLGATLVEAEDYREAFSRAWELNPPAAKRCWGRKYLRTDYRG